MITGYHLRRDGERWVATGPVFIDRQSSPVGIGATKEAAVAALLADPLYAELRGTDHAGDPTLDDFAMEEPEADPSLLNHDEITNARKSPLDEEIRPATSIGRDTG